MLLRLQMIITFQDFEHIDSKLRLEGEIVQQFQQIGLTSVVFSSEYRN